MMKTLTIAAALLSAFLAGCGTPPPKPPPPPAPQLPPKPAEPVATEPQLSKEALALLAKHDMTPIKGGLLNARADCDFRDPTGYRGQLSLRVKGAAVEHFDARVDIPNRGSCQFRLADFQQTATQPIVILTARQSSCRVRLWEQDAQVTVAFRDCSAECSGNSVDYLWPILVDNQKGSCS